MARLEEMSAAGGSASETSTSALLLGWLAAFVWRVRRTGLRGLAYSTIGAAGGVALALILPPQYAASASFIAQGSSASLLPSALQGIAASVGLANTKDYSPQFYADLLTSTPVLTAVLSRGYRIATAQTAPEKTYFEIEHVGGADSAQRVDNALRLLRRRVAARADVRTNIITVSVTARYPDLSRDLTQVLLEALDSMNINFRREQSRELRQFFESRVHDAQLALDSAETDLRQFLERNRATQGSPLLTFEQVRLSRTADLKRTVYTTVVQQYEEAKAQEAKNVPVLTVLSPPTMPTRRSGPPRRLIVALGFLVGLLAALFQDQVGIVLRQVSQ
jgi:uncharacterized protein involved in exopolysaccharide biosynthesis